MNVLATAPLIFLRSTGGKVGALYDAGVVIAGLIDAVVPVVTFGIVGTGFQNRMMGHALDKWQKREHARLMQDPAYRQMVEEREKMLSELVASFTKAASEADPDAKVEVHRLDKH
jgi:hypothetical protein